MADNYTDPTTTEEDPKMAGDNPGESSPDKSDGYDITLEETPDITEAFAKCEPGETLTLVSKGDGQVVLHKEMPEEASNEGDVAAPDAGAEPKSAVGRLMARKMSR